MKSYDLYCKLTQLHLRKQGVITAEYMSFATNILLVVSDFNGKMVNFMSKRIKRMKEPDGEINKLADRNRVILDTMLDSFLLTDANLNIIDTNIALCKMLGYSREELLRMNVADIDAMMSTDEIKNNAQRALKAGIIQFETKNKKKDGTIIDVEVGLVEMEIEGQIYIASFGRDITARKRAEELIRENEKQLSSAAQIARLAYWEYDVKSRLFTFNDQFYSIFKTTVERVGGYIVSAEKYETLFVYDEDKDLVRAETIKAIKSADANYNHQFEYRVLYPDGTIGNAVVRYSIFKDAHGNTNRVFGTIQDITERKKAEEALFALEQEILNQKLQSQRKIMRAIIKGQESERNRIGQELHDNVCQILTGVKLQLDMAAKRDPKFRSVVEYPLALLTNSIDEIRFLSRDSVTPLKDITLEELIHMQIKNLEAAGIHTDFIFSDTSEAIDDELKLNVYRIVQELINNIIKHAHATSVTIDINIAPTINTIVLTDNGAGFDFNKRRSGIGISNMISRVESFNGEFAYITSPGNGCRIEIKLPV
jgi:PAS domain S-box-containing protein